MLGAHARQDDAPPPLTKPTGQALQAPGSVTFVPPENVPGEHAEHVCSSPRRSESNVPAGHATQDDALANE